MLLLLLLVATDLPKLQVCCKIFSEEKNGNRTLWVLMTHFSILIAKWSKASHFKGN